MKRIANESEPVVVVPVVVEPIEVDLALGVVPPDEADSPIAPEGKCVKYHPRHHPLKP
ncbi:MAG: hypothetical protein Q8Q37_02620 [bacterium]|nr:hypothetical protein [bacterium]